MPALQTGQLARAFSLPTGTDHSTGWQATPSPQERAVSCAFVQRRFSGYGFDVLVCVPVVHREAWWRASWLPHILICLGLLCLAGSARAQGASEPPHSSAAERAAASDELFGPQITIEAIEVTGNDATDADVIVSALPIGVGDTLRAGSARLREARYRILALGFFRRVKLSLAKGSRRGHVVLLIEVEERGTIVLNRLYFGTSLATPWWAGVDLGERNFLGTGVAVGAAFVVAGKGNAEGATAQQSFELRAADSAFFGSRYGWRGAVRMLNASEPYRVSGEASDGRIVNYNAFDYRRLGGKGGLSRSLTSLSRIDFGGRIEQVWADLPASPRQELPDGSSRDVDLHLQDGNSRVVTLGASYDRDTRADPVLTWRGDRLRLHGEAGHRLIGSSYDYGSIFARYQRWWPVRGRQHVVSAHFGGGLVFGDVPLFDRLHVGDINRMVSPRALGLTTAVTPSLDVLGTSADERNYGEVGGLAEVQYAYRLFDSSRYVYGGELFVGGGLWTLATTTDLAPRGTLPVDILLDIGLRLDTEIGIFELSLANALGRLPL